MHPKQTHRPGVWGRVLLFWYRVGLALGLPFGRALTVFALGLAFTGMWNRAMPAPEYRFAWKDRAAARASFERILSWDFDRIVIAHGDLIESNAKNVAREAWRKLLPRD